MKRFWGALLACLLPVAGLAQQSDKDFLTNYLEQNLSGAGRAVVITGFAGALSSRATMAEMTIADDLGVWLTLKDVSLDWSQSALLSGEIVINALSAGEIDLERLPAGGASGMPSASAKGFALPDLPVSIAISGIAARRIVLGAAVLGQPVTGHLTAELQLAGGAGSAKLLLERTDGPQGRVALTASFTKPDQLVLSLLALEDAGGIAVGLLGVPGRPSAELSIEGQGPISAFAADVSLKTDGVARLAGKLALTGDASGQGFTADLAGDPTPVFLPDYAAFFGPDVRLHAAGQRFVDGSMTLSKVHVQAQALALDGSMTLDPQNVPEAFALSGTLGLPGGTVVLPLPSAQKTSVEHAELSLTYDRNRGDGWQGKAVVQGLDHPAFKAMTTTLSGAGHIVQDAGGTRFDGHIGFDSAGLAMADPGLALALGDAVTGQADLEWHSGATGLGLSNLGVSGQGFQVATTGTIGGLADGLTLIGSAQGQYSDLARLSGIAGRALSGAASFDLTGSGSPLSGVFDVTGTVAGHNLTTGISQLDGLLRGDSTVKLSVRRDEAGTEVRSVDLRAATLEVSGQGKILANGADLTGDISFGDMAVLGAGYRGALVGKAALTGTLDTGLLTLEATGTDLGLGQVQADRLLRGDSTLAMTLRLDHGAAVIERAVIRNAQATIEAKGRLANAVSDVKATVDLPDLGVLGGGYRGGLSGQVAFTGTALDGHLAVTGKASGLAIGQAEADTLLRGDTALVMDLGLMADGVRVNRVDLRNPQVTATAKGTYSGGAWRLELEQRIADLALLYPQFPGALVAKGTAVQDASGYAVDLVAKGPGQIDATVKGRLAADFGRADLAIVGTATAALANKLAEPRQLSGPLRFDLRLVGPLALASLNGPVTISGGRLADPARSFALQDIAGTAQLGGGRAQVTGQAAVSTGGAVSVSGSVGLTAPYPADLAIALDRVVLRDPDLYTTKLSGALTLRGPALGGALVAGSVALDRTELRIPSTGLGADGGLPGLQHLREPAEVHVTRVRAGLVDLGGAGVSSGGGYALDLRISAQNQVFIRGRGLDAELGGSLTLRGTTQAIIPSGAFNLIRGRLDILGKRLDLSEALLQLQGALVPFVRIVASVESDGITSSVLIEGAADDPLVSFTASPELPQEEVLARLLFGRGLANITAFQAVQLAGAVATLAGQGGEGVIGNLRKKAGLDNLDVKTDATGDTSVTAGKYLSDKLYTEVTVDQLGKSAISLNLDVASHVTVKGHVDSDGQTGIGVFLQKDY